MHRGRNNGPIPTPEGLNAWQRTGLSPERNQSDEVNRLVAQLWKEAAPEEVQEKRKQQQTAYQKLMEQPSGFETTNLTTSSTSFMSQNQSHSQVHNQSHSQVHNQNHSQVHNQSQSHAAKLRSLQSQLEKSWDARNEQPPVAATNPAPRSTSSHTSAPAVLEYEAMLKERLAEGKASKEEPTTTAHTSAPSAPSSSKVAGLYSRTEMWKQNKENQLDNLRQRRLQEEEARCSFKPSINRFNGAPKVQSTDVVDRLYQAKKHTETSLDTERKKRQAAESEACTFQPHLNRNEWTEHVEPRYLSGNNTSVSTASSRRSVQASDEECTFRPRINSYHPATAQGYLEIDAFERLSVPVTRNEEQKRHQRWFYEDSDMQGTRQAVEGDDDFLDRVKEHEHKRLEKMEYLKANDPSNHEFKPDINKKSKAIVESRGGMDFFDRLESDQQLRERRGKTRLQEKQQGRVDEECSFKPKITPSARSLRPRTAEELSYGDMERQEERRKRGARERHDKELDNCTFSPSLRHHNADIGIKSKVSVKSDPMGYIQWAKAKTQQRTHHLEVERKRREDDDMKCCTFQPKIHSAPGYISTIAASVSLAKNPTTASRVSSRSSTHTFGYD